MYSKYIFTFFCHVLLTHVHPWLLLTFWPRLLRPLHLGLPVLRVPDTLQHDGGAGLVRSLHVRGLLLLLLLHRRTGRRLQLPLRHGLRHHGRLLRVLGLPGNLHGVLRNLLPHIERPVLMSVFGNAHPGRKNGRKRLLWSRLIQEDEACVSVWERECLSVGMTVQCEIKLLLRMSRRCFVQCIVTLGFSVKAGSTGTTSNSTDMTISASVNSSFLLRIVSFV